MDLGVMGIVLAGFVVIMPILAAGEAGLYWLLRIGSTDLDDGRD